MVIPPSLFIQHILLATCSQFFSLKGKAVLLEKALSKGKEKCFVLKTFHLCQHVLSGPLSTWSLGHPSAVHACAVLCFSTPCHRLALLAVI